MKPAFRTLALLLALMLALSGCAQPSRVSEPVEGSADAPEVTAPAAEPVGSAEFEPAEGAPVYDMMAAPWDVYVPQRQEILDAGCALGVVLLGGTSAQELSEVMAELRQSEQAADFDFLFDLPEDRYVTNGGYELYLVIPLDPEGMTEVWSWTFDDTAPDGYADEPLFIAADGAPFLLHCNAGDLPSTEVCVYDSAWNATRWKPFLSGYDGSVVTEADGGTVLDLTRPIQ